jgi:signal transduction histidine kinase
MFLESPGGEQRVRLERRALVALALAYPWVLAASMALKPSLRIQAAFWPPYAMSYVAYRMLPATRWPWVVLAVLAADLIIVPAYGRLFYPWPARLSVLTLSSLANSLMCIGMVATVATARRLRGLQRFGGIMRFLWLVLLGLGAAPGVALMAWNAEQHGYGPFDALDLLAYLLTCILSVQAGCPLLFALLRGDQEIAMPPAQRWESLGVAALFAALAACFLLVRWPLRDRFSELFLVAVPLVWMALRFSRRAVAAAVAVIAATLAYAAGHGAGEFGALVHASHWGDAILSTQIFLMVACGEALLINRTIMERQRLVEQYARKQAELKSYADALDQAEERARRGAAGELHAGVGQILAGQAMILGAMRQHSTVPGPFHSMLTQAFAASREALTAVEHTIHDLSPPQLSDASLEEMLRVVADLFATRYAFSVSWSVSGAADAGALPVRLAYRTVRELVYNAYKHSRTDRVAIAVAVLTERMEIRVSDAGIGFEPVATSGDRTRYGLVNVAGRIRAVGGHFDIDSGLGRGCRITVSLPLDAGASAGADAGASASEAAYGESLNSGRLASRSTEGADKPKWA